MPKVKAHKRCDQCELLRINGVVCHETSCPNSGKRWIPERQEWVRFVKCYDCGFDVELGESCDCHCYDDGGVEE